MSYSITSIAFQCCQRHYLTFVFPSHREAFDLLTTKIGRHIGQGAIRGRSSDLDIPASAIDTIEERASIFRTVFKSVYTEGLKALQQDEDKYVDIISYWDKKSFKFKSKMTTDDAENTNTFPEKFTFLEDENGDRITIGCLSNMRTQLVNIFNQIGKLKPSMIAPNWGAVDPELKELTYEFLNLKFPELTLCSSNWKTITLAQDKYAYWVRKSPFKQKVKEEKEIWNLDDMDTTLTDRNTQATGAASVTSPPPLQSTTISLATPTIPTIPSKRLLNAPKPVPKKKAKTIAAQRLNDLEIGDPLFDSSASLL